MKLNSNSARLPTNFGLFEIHSYLFNLADQPDLALVTHDFNQTENVLIRIHSECLTGDVFGSTRCDCGFQLNQSLIEIQKAGGMLIYLRQEGRGIGLHHKISAYRYQDDGMDTVEANQVLGYEADLRDYSHAVNILNEFNIKSVRLITNNPNKSTFLKKHGILVSEMIPMIKPKDVDNEYYLDTKRDKLGHILPKSQL